MLQVFNRHTDLPALKRVSHFRVLLHFYHYMLHAIANIFALLSTPFIKYCLNRMATNY